MVILKIKLPGDRDWRTKVFSSMMDALKYAETHDGAEIMRDFTEVKVQKRRKNKGAH